MAVALGLAGDALDRPECRTAGAAAVRAALTLSEHDQGIADAGLCHGSGGLLHLTRLVLGDDDPATHALARRTVDRFEPDSLFGYRASVPGADHRPDAPGFLEGAAGVALALHAYATGGPTASGWDAALLAR